MSKVPGAGAKASPPAIFSITISFRKSKDGLILDDLILIDKSDLGRKTIVRLLRSMADEMEEGSTKESKAS